MPDYDYIEDKDPESSIVTNDELHYSVSQMDIYKIPEGDTMKFINQPLGRMLQPSEEENQVPCCYEIHDETVNIYEDPGVKKEKIYEWFDIKKVRKNCMY